MSRATSDHELCHLLAAAQAVVVLHGSKHLHDFGVVVTIENDGSGGFGVVHEKDPDLCIPIHEFCALGPVLLKLNTPAALVTALMRDTGDRMDELTAAGGLSSNDRVLARQIEGKDKIKQARVLLGAQHLIVKRLRTSGFTALSKALRDAVDQNIASGELSLADFVPPPAARGADAAAQHALKDQTSDTR